jgi:hypothetical protein
MTTSVFYPTDVINSVQLYPASQARAFGNSLAVAASVTENVNSTGTKSSPSFAMTTGTLTNTPASGDVLLVVLQYGDNNAVTTAPSGWANLFGAGTAGSRRLEIWWYRSTGVVGDKGPFTFNCSAGATFFGTQFFCFTGNAACGDPSSSGGGAFASTADPAAWTTTIDDLTEAPGMVLTAFVVGGGTISGIAGSYSGTGTQESHATYIDTGFNRGGSSVIDLYNNADYVNNPTWTFGTDWSWTTSRPGHFATIILGGGGIQSVGTNLGAGAGIKGGGSVGSPTYPGGNAETITRYDTSTIPDTNTITSATLTVRASDRLASGLGSILTDDPANADLQARFYGTGAMPSDTRGNNNNHWWLTSSAFAAKTLLASHAAASAWVNNTDYNLVNSGTALIDNISKTSGTVIAWGTSDQATSTSRTTAECYGMVNPATYSTLTVVHSFVGSATMAASLTTTPTLSQIATFPRTIAATLTSTPVLATVTSYLRTITSSIDLTPVLSRVPNFARTITATLTGTGNVTATYQPFSVQVARIVRLAGRSTLKLTQIVTARLGGRSTIRAPKE